jgi:mannose-6-phosphate isomerase
MSADPAATVPQLMRDNRVPLSYLGGERIDGFRAEPGSVRGPEDWVGSVWELPPQFARGEAEVTWGLSTLADGRVLRDAIAADPETWLGSELAQTTGATPGVLVKLLDAGERLPVHFHPGRSFAARHLGSAYGKTEGWVILDAAAGASAWLGFREEVEASQVRDWIERQDAEAMLAAMNRRDVVAGDAIYVPAGVPHAFGPGILLCELQEPTSFSIHLEHRRFGMDDNVATLGLGWEQALEGLELGSMTAAVDDLWSASRPARCGPGGCASHLFPERGTQFFDALRVEVAGELDLAPAAFAVVVVLAGSGVLGVAAGSREVAAGETWVIPYGAGGATLAGEVNALLCMPPSA